LVNQGTNFLTLVDNEAYKPAFNMNFVGGALVNDVTRNVSSVTTAWSEV